MDATIWIALWAFSFLASHLIISSSAVRARLIAALGEQPYRGIYSIVAAATLGPLIYEFARNKHAGPLLWYLRADAPIRWLAWLLMLAAFILFGIAHVLMNGWAGDVIFFGMFPALGIVGGMHQDRRKIRELGERYREFLAKTSFVPFAALVGGRVQWTGGDMPWAAIGAGVVLTIAIVALHPTIFGGNPL